MLCDLLLQSGVMGQPKEYLKPEFIDQHSELHLIDKDPIEGKLTYYLDQVFKHYHLGNGCNGLKLSWDQVERICNFDNSKSFLKRSHSKVLKKYFGDCRFILLTRANLIEQSVSAFLSNNTGIWHMWDEKDTQIQPEFDFKSVMKFTKEFAEHNYRWKRALLDARIEFIEIFYEDLILDKVNSIKKTTEFILRKKVQFVNEPVSSIKKVNVEAKNDFMNIILDKLKENA
jgi:LPS sulfotransferase NodH